MSNIDTLSPVLGLLLMGDGLHNDDWGDQTNTNLETIEDAIAGVTNITGLTGGTSSSDGGIVTLVQSQTNAQFITLSGTLINNQVIIVPNVPKGWLFINETAGNFPLTVKTAAGTGVVIAQGASTSLYSDGTNVNQLTIPGAPIGTGTDFFGIELADARYVFANGQALDRTLFASAFAAITRPSTATIGGSLATIPISEDLSKKGLVGSVVEGVGIPTGTTALSFTSTTVTLSAVTTGSATPKAIRFFPYGNGDAATTFNVPDKRERVTVGSGTMGGVASPGLVTTATLSHGSNLGSQGGAETHALSEAENGPHAHGVTDPGHVHGTSDPTHLHGFSFLISNVNNTAEGGGGGSAKNAGGFSSTTNSASTGLSITSHTTGITINSDGSGTAHLNMQPSLVCNYIVRVA